MNSRIHKVGKYQIIEIENEDQADSEERAHPEMVEGLKLTLEKLLEAREDPEKAETVFKTLYHLLDGGTGAPNYPEFSWDFLQYFLDVGVPFLLRPREQKIGKYRIIEIVYEDQADSEAPARP